MNPHEPPPLKPSLTPAQVSNLWSRISQPPAPRRVALTWRGAGLAFAAMALLVWLGRPAPAPLLVVGTQVTSRQKLADDSEISPQSGASLEVLRSTGAELAVLQRAGRVRYSVTEGGPRRWIVETALGSVEVLGTIFTVDVRSGALAVEVERGRVFVRGATRAVTLRAGESVTLAPEVATQAAPALEPPPSPAPVLEQPDAGPVVTRVPRLVPSPRRTAGAVLGSAATLPPGQAAELLETWLASGARDADWAIVALRLGTLELDDRGAPARALRWFDAVVAVGAPPSALEDASARRVDALLALGRDTEARAAAKAFRARWPASSWGATLPQ